jgi:hypothetical protein
MDAMSIDMNTAGNTAMGLGTRESCGEVTPGGSVTFDVTAQGIPPWNDNGTPGDTSDDSDGIEGFQLDITYDEAALTIEAENQHFILAANPGSVLYQVSDSAPDADGDNTWRSAVIDIGTGSPEGGSGVLSRVTISAEPAAPAGYYALHLPSLDAIHIDAANEAHKPDILNDALLAVGVPCAGVPVITPTPVAVITPSPGTTPPPATSGPTPDPEDLRMERMALDMQTSGNTATLIGRPNECVEAVPGGQVTADLTAKGIPVYSDHGTPGNTGDDYGGIVLYQTNLLYSEAALTVQSQDQQQLLAANPGSVVANGSEALPDVNADDEWFAAGVDTASPSSSVPESGNGVLARLTILIDASAAPAVYPINLEATNTGHSDASGKGYVPKSIGNGMIAVSVDCDIDGDGVEDNLDACETVPGPASNSGCPPAGPGAVGGIAGLSQSSHEAWMTPEESPTASERRLVVAAILIAGAGLSAVYVMSSWSGRPRR